MIHGKSMKNIFYLAAIISLVSIYSCKFKSPAPAGIHGEYSLTPDSYVYQANGINKDSVLSIFKMNDLKVTGGKLNNYDAPWDSLRYLIGNIPCDTQNIEAYIEFTDKKALNIWFNATPTDDDEKYEKLAKGYYECFEALLKKSGIIK